jgi:hypothetical protein
VQAGGGQVTQAKGLPVVLVHQVTGIVEEAKEGANLINREAILAREGRILQVVENLTKTTNKNQ